ncbi:unnamed protein product [Orchesella dallaii]|uniref:F-box domain-containing protein n=1 Tax=Orchesella dallaii TaxID=48710 RepID=A0ABP1Q4Y2_9HEXA
MNPLEQFAKMGGKGGGGGDQPLVEAEPVHKNPLLIDVVLDKLFPMVLVEDLKSARLVCKLWWKSSLPQWRKSCLVQIRGDRQDGNRRIVKGSVRPQPSPYTIHDFVDFRGKWSGTGDPFQFEKFPFHKFNLSCVNLDLSKNGRECRSQLEFWKVVGAQMTHLKISKSAFCNVQTFKMILFELTPKLEALKLEKNFYKGCPRFSSPSIGQSRVSQPLQFVKNYQDSLKEISIVLREFDAESLYRSGKCDPIELPLSWAEILVYFPNVVSVHLENIDTEDYNCPSLEGFLETAINLRNGTPNSLNLNVLNIMNAKMNCLLTLPNGILSHLKALHWPLTSLTLDVGVTDSNVLREVLHLHAASLKMLTVFRAPYAYPFPNFPFGVQLNFLEELKVIGPIFQDLLFLEFMPQLKRLLIGEENLNKPFEFAIEPANRSSMEYKNPDSIIAHTDFGLIPDLVLNHLVEFNGGDEQVCPMEKLDALAKLMPNLKILELKVVGDGLSCADITQNWKGLEKVNLVLQHADSNVDD